MNALVKATPQGGQVATLDFTAPQLALIRKTIAADCDEQEFDLFMEVARFRGLNPFANQVSPIVFSKGDKEKRKMVIVTRIDGARAIAQRLGDYRPMEGAPLIEIDEALKDPLCNPAGIVRAEVKLWKRSAGDWFPVIGEAYWEEFAPIKEECAEGYDWVETGETWADSGKPKKKKVPKSDKKVRQLDTTGNWGRMPRLMIAKCAEMQALRRGWPEDYSGLYVDEELDQAKVIDVASEIVADYEEAERLKRIGVSGKTLMFVFDPAKPIENVERGRIADRLFEFLRDEAQTVEQITAFLERNKVPLQTFWGWDRAEALEVKKFADQRIATLKEHGQ